MGNARLAAILAAACGLSVAAEGSALRLSASAFAAGGVPDSLLADSLNRWPGASAPGPVGQPAPDSAQAAAPATPTRALRDSIPPAMKADSARRADSAAALTHTLNLVTGSNQTPAPIRWKRRAPYPGAPLLLSLPAADFPYTLRGGFDSPSMRQSLLLSAGAIQWADQTIAWLWSTAESPFLRNLGTYSSLGLFAWISTYLPLGDAWVHEEWHRAVLTRRGISSYDGIYHWDIGAETISVDHVADRDLADLKDRHPADFTRLSEAGLEGEIESVRLMRRRNFFLDRPSYSDRIGWWVNGLNGAAYIWISSEGDLDQDLRDANAREREPSQRDFTGLDFRAWVHDLRHPAETYASGPRGRLHPSGAGFDRYLLDSDLTSDEKGFLKLQAGLSLLNLVSGQHLGWDWLPGINPWTGQGYLWNFGLTHHLTPFGYAVGGEFLARQGKADWIFTAQGMANASLVLPCLGAELFRYPVTAGRRHLFLSAAATAWLQPERQRFRASSADPGAYGSLGLAVPLSQSLEVFGEADAKTAGWMPGVAYLEPIAEGRLGLQIRL
jgi:hypothetical protein